MNRREFLQAGTSMVLSVAVGYGAEFEDRKPRVGLIGCGWYGKCDLFRLIQVAPVEVVSLCDVDKKMLAEAAEMVAARQASKKKPRTYGDYREMLKEKDLDIVLVAHAGPLARPADDRRGRGRGRCLRAEADQRGRGRGAGDGRRRPQAQARRPGRHAAPQHAAPHRGPRHHRQGRQARQGRPGRGLLLLPHAGPRESAGHGSAGLPRLRDVDRARPPCGLTTSWSTRGAGGPSWSTATASWATCASTCSTWSAGCSDLGWPKRVASTGGILVEKGSKANIPDTQTATFDFGDLEVVWQHRTWGQPADPKYPWGATLYGDKGTLKVSVHRLRLHAARTTGKPVHRDVVYELEKYPEDKTEKDLERHVAPAIRGPHAGLPARRSRHAASRWPTSSRATSRRRAASWPTCR